MGGRIFAHRNLNEARRDWSVFIYSYGDVKGNVGRGKVAGYSDDIVMLDVDANCQQAGLRAILTGPRQVSAWLLGTPTDDRPAPDATLRKFSINPKLGELEFRWSDTREPVKFPLPAVHLTRSGCYAILTGAPMD